MSLPWQYSCVLNEWGVQIRAVRLKDSGSLITERGEQILIKIGEGYIFLSRDMQIALFCFELILNRRSFLKCNNAVYS